MVSEAVLESEPPVVARELSVLPCHVPGALYNLSDLAGCHSADQSDFFLLTQLLLSAEISYF